MNTPPGADGPARQPPTFGPEPWRDHQGITWSHWDRWACVVAVVDHDGDLAGLEAHLVDQLRTLDGRDATEAKLSHLTDLRARLTTAGLTAPDLAGSDPTADRTLVAKARSKLASRGLEGRAMTPAMHETPRVRLRRRARRGHWRAFPVPPERFYERFRAAVEVKGHITKNRSVAKTRALGERLERLDGPRRRHDERLALYRAFHTAGVELADRADDSYGNIGELRENAWRTYLTIDPAAAGMDPAAWWQDLCELIVWEPYGLGHDHQTLPYRKLGAVDVDTVEGILLSLADEHRAVHLDWEADEALQQVAWLHAAHRRWDRYPDAARRLGSDHWTPIVALAQAALARRRADIAVDVFRAADKPGFHRDYLQRRCRELTGVDLAANDDLRG
ncbi:MAG: hypothetical protein ACRD29_02225 [Acidimicrobiales bacterium]